MKRLYLAAQMQALVLAMAREHPEQLLTQADVCAHPEAKRLQAQDHHALSALTCLAKAGHLVRVRMGAGRQRYAYELPADRKPKPKAAIIVPPAEEPCSGADVKVTVVKSSGALRVEFKGIRIEIGVAE